MFSKEFETVYREAFASATGHDFDAAMARDDVRAERDTYIATTVNALTEYWASDDYDATPLRETRITELSSVMRMKSPQSGELTREDAENIARVRYLGRTIIDFANVYLGENETIKNGDDDLQSMKWYTAHPEADPRGDDLAHDPHAGSPQRLRHWPHGDYVNCLGVSIGMAAESERRGHSYYYVNKLRDVRQAATLHYLSNVDRYYEVTAHPYGKEVDELLHLVDYVVHRVVGEDETAARDVANCYAADPELTEALREGYAHQVDTAFHTSVLRHEAEDVLVQHDPYQLIVRHQGIQEELVQEVLAEMPFSDAARCNELLIVETRAHKLMGRIDGAIKEVVRRAKTRLEQTLQHYHSPKMLRELSSELRSVYEAMTDIEADTGDIANERLFEGGRRKDRQYEDLWDAYWPSFLAAVFENDDAVIDTQEVSSAVMNHLVETWWFMEDDAERQEASAKIYEPIEQAIYERIQYDTKLRERFNEAMLRLPEILGMHVMERYLNNILVIKIP